MLWTFKGVFESYLNFCNLWVINAFITSLIALKLPQNLLNKIENAAIKKKIEIKLDIIYFLPY